MAGFELYRPGLAKTELGFADGIMYCAVGQLVIE